MAQHTKRDATEAFGEKENASAVPEKRTRRKTKYKDSGKPGAVSKTLNQDSAPPSETIATALAARSNKPVADLEILAHNASGSQKGLSNGSGRTKRYKDKGAPPGEKASQIQSPAVPTQQQEEHRKPEAQHPQNRASTSQIERRKDRSHPSPKSGWTKLVGGGYFLDQDPLLSQDEQ